jgi:hypothetical protein
VGELIAPHLVVSVRAAMWVGVAQLTVAVQVA